MQRKKLFVSVLLGLGVGLGAWVLGPVITPMPQPVLAAMPEEQLPQDPLDASVWSVVDGVGHLKIAAKSGSPALLQEAEREILVGLLAGLSTTTGQGSVDADAYARVYGAYEHAQGVFKDLPYRLVVEPGGGLRSFDLPLRRHPWLVLMEGVPAGWQVEMVESGARLTPAR